MRFHCFKLLCEEDEIIKNILLGGVREEGRHGDATSTPLTSVFVYFFFLKRQNSCFNLWYFDFWRLFSGFFFFIFVWAIAIIYYNLFLWKCYRKWTLKLMISMKLMCKEMISNIFFFMLRIKHFKCEMIDQGVIQ